MDRSHFLGKVIGLYLLIISLVMLAHMDRFMISINELINNNTAMLIVAFFTLILGILLVVSHNVWQWNWRVLITLIGWITLIKSVSILLYLPLINQLSAMFFQNVNMAYLAAGVDLILGLILLYFGYRR